MAVDNKHDGMNGSLLRWAAGVVAAIFLGLVGWLFAAVVSLQVAVTGIDERQKALRDDFSRQATSDINYQHEVRDSIATLQAATQTANQRLADLIGDIRIQLGKDGQKK